MLDTLAAAIPDIARAGAGLKTANGEQIASGIWTLVVVNTVTVLALGLRAWLKNKQIDVDVDKEAFDRLYARVTDLEGKVDLADRRARDADERARQVEREATERVRQAEDRAREVEKEASEHVHKSDMRLMTVISAYQLVVADQVAKDPENPVLLRAQEMMATASKGDFGLGDGIKRLSTMRGVGE